MVSAKPSDAKDPRLRASVSTASHTSNARSSWSAWTSANEAMAISNGASAKEKPPCAKARSASDTARAAGRDARRTANGDRRQHERIRDSRAVVKELEYHLHVPSRAQRRIGQTRVEQGAVELLGQCRLNCAKPLARLSQDRDRLAEHQPRGERATQLKSVTRTRNLIRRVLDGRAEMVEAGKVSVRQLGASELGEDLAAHLGEWRLVQGTLEVGDRDVRRAALVGVPRDAPQHIDAPGIGAGRGVAQVRCHLGVVCLPFRKKRGRPAVEGAFVRATRSVRTPQPAQPGERTGARPVPARLPARGR